MTMSDESEDNTIHFSPPINLDNIPHCLRKFAMDIAAGVHGDVPAVICIIPVLGSNGFPLAFGFGADDALDDIRIIGTLELAKAFFTSRIVTRE